MKTKFKIAIGALAIIIAAALCLFYLSTLDIPMIYPKGLIALKQRNLMFIAALLMLIVVIPVFIFTFWFSWKYRAENRDATYTPNWDHSYLAECFWWGVPCAIILVLGIITWKTSHDLNPFKPIESNKKPLTIQVVALQWKWLFIYPEQAIATVNFVQFPENTPIVFEITAQAPMNSFWIPQLGGQIYAMSGMRTKLNLIANEPGSFRGCSANISGTGFSGMNFIAKATSEQEFDQWVNSVVQSADRLDMAAYDELAKPSQYNPVALYVLTAENLFDRIIMKYTMPPRE